MELSNVIIFFTAFNILYNIEIFNSYLHSFPIHSIKKEMGLDLFFVSTQVFVAVSLVSSKSINK